MPRGYPDTCTCPNCGSGEPAEYHFCPWCGEELHKKKGKKISSGGNKE